MELCEKCLRLKIAHNHGHCPGGGVSVTIDAYNIERTRRTGHPRLLAAVLNGTQKVALVDVHIERVRVVDPC